MDELAAGLWYWTARHEHIGADVSSYYLLAERVLIDPMLPPGGGLQWLEEHGPPEHVLMTNRHHDRDAWRIRERFGCAVHCIRNGLHELEGRGPAEPFDFGDELPGGVVAHEVDAICPDETALHIEVGEGFLSVADGLINYDGLGFVSDGLIGDDPEAVKDGLRTSYRRLLSLDFDGVMCAHGDPMSSGAKKALREFVG